MIQSCAKDDQIYFRIQKYKKIFHVAYVSRIFYISLQKISCISAKYSSKLDILPSICIIFAEDKIKISKIFK